MKTILHLENVVEIETLQKIQDEFSEATGFAAITVDYRGKPITEHSGCSPYCQIIRNRPETGDLCEKCDSRAGLEAARTGKPYIYMCHSGFMDFAAPIIVNEQYLGAIMGGQVVTTEKLSNVKYIINETVDIEDDVELIEAYSQIPIVPYKKIEAAANMMFNIANAIAEKGYLNMMHKQLHQQSIQLMESNASKMNLQNALKEAELKTLQSQINRQFLLQMLNTIGNLSYIENAGKTEETTYHFIEVVKFLLANMNKDVLVEDELSYIENYLYLQRTRLGSRLSYECTVDEQAKKLLIPSMIIQPIVENSIIHGIETKEGQGNITVKISTYNKQLTIEVSDNGLGMKEIKTAQSDESSSPMSLRLLKRRLKDRFDDKATIKVFSKCNTGTTVTVTIPCFSAHQ